MALHSLPVSEFAQLQGRKVYLCMNSYTNIKTGCKVLPSTLKPKLQTACKKSMSIALSCPVASNLVTDGEQIQCKNHRSLTRNRRCSIYIRDYHRFNYSVIEHGPQFTSKVHVSTFPINVGPFWNSKKHVFRWDQDYRCSHMSVDISWSSWETFVPVIHTRLMRLPSVPAQRADW